MTALTRWLNSFSSAGSDVSYKEWVSFEFRVSVSFNRQVAAALDNAGKGKKKRNQMIEESHLSGTQCFVVGQIEDVLDQLRHGIAADPEEDVLAVFNEEETMALKTLRCQRQRWRQDDAVLADRAGL
jgi:hypothetical protein